MIKENELISNEYAEDEMSLLSNMMFGEIEYINHESIKKIFEIIKPEMFFNKQAKEIFNIFKEVYKSCELLLGTKAFIRKMQTVASFEHPELEDYIGEELPKFFASSVTLPYWIKRVQQFYFNQRYKLAMSREECEKIIKEETELTSDQTLVELSDNANDLLKEYDLKMKTAIKTPFKGINRYIGSLQGGDMVVLAGTTGGGKTAFMLNFAKGVAKEGKQVIIFSLEMPKQQLQQRIVCSEAGIDASKFRNFTMTDEEKKNFSLCADKLKELPIKIYKKQTVSIYEIRSVVRAIKATSDKPLIVFIDYMGLINSYENKSRYEKFSNISRDIKLLAMETDVPIVALHQLNRDIMSEQRKDKKPKTSDLRDSGQIEQDADMIWFVHRPCVFDETANKSEMNFILAKDRHGESNITVPLKFDGKFQTITEVGKYC